MHEDRESWIRDWEEGRGEFRNITKYPLVTWVFEEGTFVPAAKISEKEKLSIVTNYLGTPEAMFREDGEKVWTCELNSYGKVRNFQGESKTMCNWRFQGQYEDSETGLYYNRFRYYSPEEGIYLSQDPIGLGGGFELYSYVHDPNTWIDIFGLNEINDKGALGEYNAGISKIKNTSTTIKSSSSRYDYRVPDAINKSGTVIIEVKNTKKQGYTRQIKDDVTHVNQQAKLQKGANPRVFVVVDNNTQISRELLKQHNDPNSPICVVRKDLNKPRKSCP